MKNLIRIFSFVLLFSAYSAGAQEVVRTDTLSGTPLTISMDNRVQNALSDMEDNCERVAARNTRTSGKSQATPTRVLVPNRELTTAEICRRNPRIMGVKIQLAVVKSNEEANKVKAYFRSKFPSIKVETDASLRPNYKILAGSYFSKQSAASDLAKIRKFFNTAIPIQYRVFCVEAK